MQSWVGENQPIVSICCATYNHVKFVKEAIQSFLAQKTNFPFEIIIRDDGSTDGTTDIIRDYAKKYMDGLKDADFVLPSVPDWAEPVWHLYVIRHPRRDELQKCLANADIGSFVHYPIPPHKQEAYSEMGLEDGALPIAESIHREVLSLPIGPHLQKQQVGNVIRSLKAIDDTECR